MGDVQVLLFVGYYNNGEQESLKVEFVGINVCSKD